MPEIGEALTRKIGPLPAWAWGAVVGGGILVARALTGGGSGPDTASVAPQAIGTGVGDLPDAGGSGVADDTRAALSYITLPDGSVALDRPPEDVTIVPGPPPTPPAPVQADASTVNKLAGLIADVRKWRKLRPKAAARWAKSHPIPANEDVTARIKRLSAEVAYERKAKADTVGYPASGADTSQGVPVAPIPSMPPLPIGNVIALPVYDAPDIYRGPTFSRGPIASSARIVMPPVNGGPVGSVAVPALPVASGRAPAASGRRLLDPISRGLDRLTPDVPPTTLAPRLRIATRFRTRALNVSGKNASG